MKNDYLNIDLKQLYKNDLSTCLSTTFLSENILKIYYFQRKKLKNFFSDIYIFVRNVRLTSTFLSEMSETLKKLSGNTTNKLKPLINQIFNIN